MNIAHQTLVAQLIVSAISMVACSLFLYPVGRAWRLTLKNNSDFICYLLMIVLWFASLSGIILSLLPLYDGTVSGFDGPLGQTLCNCQTVSIAISAAAIASLHALLAIDRYVQFHYGRKLTSWQMATVIGVFGGTYMGILAYDLVSPVPWQIWDSGSVCYFVTKSDNWFDKIPILLLSSYTFIWMSTINFCYASIYNAINAIKKETAAVLKNDKVNQQQQMFLNRCLLILGATLLSYAPNVNGFTIKALANLTFPPQLDAFFTLLELGDGIFSPLVLFAMNRHNREAFSTYVLRIPEKNTISDNSLTAASHSVSQSKSQD